MKGMQTEPRPDLAHAFDTIGARYDEVFNSKPGQLAATEWILEQLGNRDERPLVIDIGCGTGLPTARQLIDGGCEVVGVDISPVMIEIARDNVPEAIFVERDLSDLDGLHPVGSRFDAATAYFSLLVLHRAEVEKTLDAICHVLHPGAFFAIGMVEGDTDYLLRDFLGEKVPLTAYPRDQLGALLSAHGFTVADLRVESWAGPDHQPQTHVYAVCVRG
jgi:SAM-dependent methyltransferase